MLLDRSGRADVSFPATEKGWSGTFDVARDSSKALFCESDQSGIDICSTWMLDFGSKAFSKLPLELLNSKRPSNAPVRILSSVFKLDG